MNEPILSPEEFLNSSTTSELDSYTNEQELSVEEDTSPIVDVPGEVPHRLKLLSHSSLQTLRSCPRKYELRKQDAQTANDVKEDDVDSQVTFSYGHVVGQGIQDILEGRSEQDIYWRAFVM